VVDEADLEIPSPRAQVMPEDEDEDEGKHHRYA
jgi:hypothetical protein